MMLSNIFGRNLRYCGRNLRQCGRKFTTALLYITAEKALQQKPQGPVL